MRYAPTERFWRNLLLTCVFTVFTLGFSVASWHGLKVSSPERPALDRGIGKQTAVAESSVGYLESAGPKAARSGGAPLEDLELGEVSPPAAPFTAANSSAAAAAAGAAGTGEAATGDRGRGQQSSAASSGRGGGGVGRGFPGVSFGGGSSKDTQVAANSGKQASSVTRHSNTKRNDNKKGGSSNKGKTKKTPTSGPSEGAGEKPSPLEGVYNGSPSGSPASTPEPLSMILVGAGLAGLYRARKYLA